MPTSPCTTFCIDSTPTFIHQQLGRGLETGATATNIWRWITICNVTDISAPLLHRHHPIPLLTLFLAWASSALLFFTLLSLSHSFSACSLGGFPTSSWAYACSSSSSFPFSSCWRRSAEACGTVFDVCVCIVRCVCALRGVCRCRCVYIGVCMCSCIICLCEECLHAVTMMSS